MIKLKCKENNEEVITDVNLKNTTIAEYVGGVFALIDSAKKNLNQDLLTIINKHYKEVKR